MNRGNFLYRLRWLIYTVLMVGLFVMPLPQITQPKIKKGTTQLSKNVTVKLVAPVAVKPKPKVVAKPLIKPKPKPPLKPKIPEKPKPKIPEKPKPKPEVSKPSEVVKPPKIQAPEPEVQEAVSVPVVPLQEVVASYESHLRDIIYAMKFYPAKARRMKHQGDVTVRFWLDATGRLKRSVILTSSGFKTLDNATEQLFERIEGFDPPPERLGEPYEFTITLNYRLK